MSSAHRHGSATRGCPDPRCIQAVKRHKKQWRIDQRPDCHGCREYTEEEQ